MKTILLLLSFIFIIRGLLGGYEMTDEAFIRQTLTFHFCHNFCRAT